MATLETGNMLPENIKNQAKNILQQSNDLFDNIQNIKTKIQDLKSEKNIQELGALQLKQEFERFSNLILQIDGLDSISRTNIATILSTADKLENTPENYRKWEMYNFTNTSQVTTITRLSTLQENIRTAEYIVLENFNRIVKSKLPKTL